MLYSINNIGNGEVILEQVMSVANEIKVGGTFKTLLGANLVLLD